MLCLVVGCSEPEPSTFSACYLVGTTTTEDAGEAFDLLGELAAASSLKLTFRNETTRNWAWSDGAQAMFLTAVGEPRVHVGLTPDGGSERAREPGRRVQGLLAQAIAPRWSVRVGTCSGEWSPWSPATGDAERSSP